MQPSVRAMLPKGFAFNLGRTLVMKRPILVVIVVVLCLVVLVLLGIAVRSLRWHARYYVVEETEYRDPPDRDELKLVDDELEDKKPRFDETLVDSRPPGDWEVNASAAVIKLDCPTVKPDTEQALLTLRPSYADAVKAASEQNLDLLPSANLLDGAAKQFDDGLYAALDLALKQANADG